MKTFIYSVILAVLLSVTGCSWFSGQSTGQYVDDRAITASVKAKLVADKAANLARAERLVARAAATGADLVALPEKWNAIGDPETLHAAAETLDEGESVAAMRRWASELGVLADDLTGAAGRLQAAAAEYRSTDRSAVPSPSLHAR